MNMSSSSMDRKLSSNSFQTETLDHEKFVRTNDDVHTSILLCPVTCAFLSTPQMQRLRGLKQLGTVEHVYVNATHTRFEHSLGVMHLAEQLCKQIQRRQPNLNISDKDVLCVKLAGLLHDIGHGPFSHIYDGVFVPAANEAIGKKSSWCHEDGSVMMIDAALSHLGLAVDLDNMDAPLKQINHGVDARDFGYCSSDDKIVQPKNIITSRDIFFIKECILGGPLPENHCFVGRPKAMEFLYDVVSNRHCGLDVDKIDYYARDSRRTVQGSSDVEVMFIEEAFVAKAICSQPEKCFQCRLRGTPGSHYMLAWPEKLVVKGMEFFKTRFSMHSKVYTHKTVKAVEFMVCDILKLADPYIKVRSSSGFKRISTAMNDPTAYLNLRDSIMDAVELSTDDALESARKLLKRLRSRDLYKCAAQETIRGLEGDKLWLLNESEIKDEILAVECQRYGENGETLQLVENDVIVEKRIIHHGLKESNPVSLMRFLPKRNLNEVNAADIDSLPEAREIEESSYDGHIPRKMLEKSIRVYCRDPNPSKVDLVHHAFYQWFHEFGKGIETTMVLSPMNGRVAMLSQDSDFETTPLTRSNNILSSHSEFKRRRVNGDWKSRNQEIAQDIRF